MISQITLMFLSLFCWSDPPIAAEAAIASRAALPSVASQEAGSAKEIALSNGQKITLRWIPAGTFKMGSPPSEKGRISNEKQVDVTLDGFWMAETEVTQGLWQSIMKKNPSNFQGNPLQPVESVSWKDASSFLKKLNKKAEDGLFRLPTEAEWEYACRAGSTTAFFFGDDPAQLHKHANFCDAKCSYGWMDASQDDGFATTAPVKSFQPNAWGLYDMHGNVWEWCADKYGPYPDGPVKNPLGTSGSDRVSRGGGWSNPATCRSAMRVRNTPDNTANDLGFRLVWQQR